jgi:hypothetical protein
VKKERMKDLIGRRVRLVKPLITRGGRRIAAGLVAEVASTWRGRFTLSTDDDGFVRDVPRDTFEVIP